MKCFTYSVTAERDFYIYADTKEEADEIVSDMWISLDVEVPKGKGGADENYGDCVEFIREEEC